MQQGLAVISMTSVIAFLLFFFLSLLLPDLLTSIIQQGFTLTCLSTSGYVGGGSREPLMTLNSLDA